MAAVPSTVIITGANGYLGTHLTRQLVPRVTVIGVTRQPMGANAGGHENVLFQELGSVAESLHRAGGNADLVHLVGSGRESAASTVLESNLGVMARLFETGLMEVVRRVVYVSGFGVQRDSSVLYYRAKALAEERVIATGKEFVILRPSYIVGQGDELIPVIRQQAATGCVSIPGDGTYRIQPVLIGDFCRIVDRMLAISRPVKQIQDILGEPIAIEHFIARLLERYQTPPRIEHIDLATLMREAIFNEDPWFSLTELAILVADKTGRPTQEVLGVRLSTLDEILEHCRGELE